MARIRSIKVDLFVDDSLAEVSVEAHLLLAGLPCIADSAGRLEDRPKRIHALLMPYRHGFDIDARLNELQAAGAVARYQVGGVRYIQVNNWDRDQRPHVKEAESTIPPPPPNCTEHRLGGELAGNSPGTRPSEPAGIIGVGCGVLDLGSGILNSPAGASAPQKAKPKPAKRKAPDKPTDVRHAPLVKALVETLGFPFDGGRDAAQVTALLALADQQPDTAGDKAPGEIIRRARIAWGQFPDYHSARSLSALRAKWGDFREPKPRSTRNVVQGPAMDDWSEFLNSPQPDEVSDEPQAAGSAGEPGRIQGALAQGAGQGQGDDASGAGGVPQACGPPRKWNAVYD